MLTNLWRVDIEGDQPPERIEVAGLGAALPATALSKDLLAFVRIVVDIDVYRFQAGLPSRPVLTSSFFEGEPRFSPDGRRLAFASMRSGDTFRIWLAAADGSDAQQFTRSPGIEEGSPWWSPDGRRIAFDSHGDDWHAHIWTMDADGGALRRLTTDPAIRIFRAGRVTAAGFISPLIAEPAANVARAGRGCPSQPVTRGG